VRSVEAEKQAAYDQRAVDVSSLKSELKTLHAQEAGSNALKRRVKVAEDSYLMYRGRLNEATGVEALETRRIGNVVIVERATDPLAPYGVRKLTLLGIALCLAIAAALAWVAIIASTPPTPCRATSTHPSSPWFPPPAPRGCAA
jgi:uncharacterized protein involved in exopolysaccharide biosynthesis